MADLHHQAPKCAHWEIQPWSAIVAKRFLVPAGVLLVVQVEAIHSLAGLIAGAGIFTVILVLYLDARRSGNPTAYSRLPGALFDARGWVAVAGDAIRQRHL